MQTEHGTLLSVTKDGLTRQEIGWLLAQEAKGAAQVLRKGIEVKVRESQAPPSPESTHQEIPSLAPELDSLSALDDAVQLLGDFHESPPLPHHRGRVDLAALLVELWPDASLSFTPGEGTEVYGDSQEIRRLIELVVSGAGGGQVGAGISIGRELDMVRVTAELGPDAAAPSNLEKRWLSRLAGRLGGQLEATGAHRVIRLPADGAAQQRELDALREELSQAQELGEAYARELADMLALSGSESKSSQPWETLTSFAKQVATHPAQKQVLRILTEAAPGLTQPPSETASRTTTELENLIQQAVPEVRLVVLGAFHLEKNAEVALQLCASLLIGPDPLEGQDSKPIATYRLQVEREGDSLKFELSQESSEEALTEREPLLQELNAH
ncbi:MAG: hypothetical protein MK135_10825, partial [Polyangiaceae bacterium]|nr:hypothetical protein [Polyangiaceae bacterium]